MSNNNMIAPQQEQRKIMFSEMINTPLYKKAIMNTLQDAERSSRFVAAITSAVSVNLALQECDYKTILSGALLGESLNLSPSPQLGQYYLVPFDNKKRGCKEAVFVPGYKGILQLAMRSGQYKHINTISIKSGELKRWNPLSEEIELDIVEDYEKREALPTTGYIAYFEYLNGFEKTIYWSKDKMIAHADRYSPAFSKDATSVKTKNGTINKVSFADYEDGNFPSSDAWLYSSFWYKSFDDMAYKTILKQLITKWGIMSIEMQTVFARDGAVIGDNGNYMHVMDEPDFLVTDTDIPDEVAEPDSTQEIHSKSAKKVGLDEVGEK